MLEENICEPGASILQPNKLRCQLGVAEERKHVKHLLNLAWDPELFDKKPVELEKIRMELLRESLKFFSEKNVFTTGSSGD